MIKFFSNNKIIFYFINCSLIFLYLYPGSLLGQVIYGSKKIQPQITPDFIISSNHFYVFVLVSLIGFLTFLNIRQLFEVLEGIDEHPVNKKKNNIINLFFKNSIFIYKILE